MFREIIAIYLKSQTKHEFVVDELLLQFSRQYHYTNTPYVLIN